jgi:ATP-binding protein involved in chromosome partitioning
MGVPYLGAIPIDPEVVVSGDHGAPVVHSRPRSAAAAVFSGIADRLLELAGDKRPS